MTNVELLVELLEQAGVRWVFGVPSGPVLPLIDALGRSAIRFVLTASETAAGFMAATIGHMTGIPGVCVATVGPGATNLTTGIGAAWLDRSPVIALTCNVASPWLERRIQMRIDHHGLFKPLTKATLPLQNGRIAATVNGALALALAEPPGPVHLDLPEDVARADACETARPPCEKTPAASGIPDLSRLAAERIAAALATACRPLVATGLTFARSPAAGAVRRFIERQGLPFVTTMQAKGSLPENHPHWLGVIGRARRSDVQAFTDQADLIVAIGYDPVEINYEEWCGKTPILHLSSEAAEEGPGLSFLWNRACDLDRASEAIQGLPGHANGWSAALWQAQREKFDRALRPAGCGFSPQDVLDILRRQLPAEGILACDVGAHAHQIAAQWRTDHPRTFLATNGWSSMGSGMPAAYAAKLAAPAVPVVGIVGDGGFQMTVGELSLARRLNLPVPIIVLNDGWLGLMKIKQERRRQPPGEMRLGDPPESPPHYFGVPCRAARSAADFQEALRWAFSLGGPSVIEAFVDGEAYAATVFD
jgi:acetolactate synthase-1/2/3 large subunit